MAPYNFDAPDTDTILRSSDGKEFRVHRLVLSLASPVFQGMFNLHQPNEPPSQIPTIDLLESANILQPFIQYIYPQTPPKISDLPTWEALYIIADKYIVEVVMKSLQDMLLHRFLTMSPFRVYALASRWGLKVAAQTASARTLQFDIFKDLVREDAELMGGGACQQLYLLHFNHREAIQNVVTNRAIPSGSQSCGCSPPDYSSRVPALCRMSYLEAIYWLSTDALYKPGSPNPCSRNCCSAS
jgi:hypothetical protein